MQAAVLSGLASIMLLAAIQTAPASAAVPAASAQQPAPAVRAGGEAQSKPSAAPAPLAALPDTLAQRVAACTACHQARERGDAYFPRIAGKPAGYLYNQLVNFREGRRNYPMMTYMVDHLPDAYLREIAQYFSEQHPPYPPPPPNAATPAMLARGRVLALQGDAGARVPACVACHGRQLSGVAPAIPGLLGLPRDYINAQFGAWRNKVRRARAPDCMAEITSRLTDADVAAVSGWLAAQQADAEARPATAASLPLPLPLACGSVPADADAAAAMPTAPAGTRAGAADAGAGIASVTAPATASVASATGAAARVGSRP